MPPAVVAVWPARRIQVWGRSWRCRGEVAGEAARKEPRPAVGGILAASANIAAAAAKASDTQVAAVVAEATDVEDFTAATAKGVDAASGTAVAAVAGLGCAAGGTGARRRWARARSARGCRVDLGGERRDAEGRLLSGLRARTRRFSSCLHACVLWVCGLLLRFGD